MRYTELPWLFENEDGLIYTGRGYRTTAQRIDGACWLMQLHEFTKSMYGERRVLADTPLTEKRPRTYD